MEETTVMMVGLKKERILQALNTLNRNLEVDFESISDYTKKNVSEKILRLIISYTDYINKRVWMK